MKHFLLLIAFAACLSLPAKTVAQIPNSGFETWNAGSPAGWITPNIPGLAIPITETATAHSGTSALQGNVLMVDYGGVILPILPTLTTTFAVSQRYATLNGYYTFTSVLGDSLFGWMLISRGSTPIGAAIFSERTTRSSYQPFHAPIQYYYDSIPDNCQIWFSIVGTEENGDTVHAGSFYRLDDLSLSGIAASVAPEQGVPGTFSLQQNYPNPFNPTTVISWQVPVAGNVRLMIYDLLGREVARLVNETRDPGAYSTTWNAGGLASGIYLCRLETTGGVQVRKMILQK